MMMRKVICVISGLVFTCGSSPVSAKLIGGIEFPGGDASFVDAVIDYHLGHDSWPPYNDPNRALGVPDGNDVSLGVYGHLVLKFTDNFLTTSGNDEHDLYVFEIGGWIEPFKVEISVDGISWIDLGDFKGQPTSIDIDRFESVVPDTTYSYVRLTDILPHTSGKPYGQADIDAVGAISSSPQIVYVDDDAPNDPGPNDLAVSDPEEDGTNEHPFDMVQEGIDAAREGVTVIVREGTYYETVRFKGRNISVTSFDPDLCGVQTYPVIDAGNSGTVVTFNQGEDPNCSLSGFVLTRGLGKPVSSSSVLALEQREPVISALACIGSSPRISNCLIGGNRCVNLDYAEDDPFGGVIYCENSNVVFESCTIADNCGGDYGASIYLVDCDVVLSNSIVWGNLPEQIMVASGNDPIVVYSNIQGSWPGKGNVDVDPDFAYLGSWDDSKSQGLMPTNPDDPNAIWIDGDYHLMSRIGRWDPLSLAWIKDAYTSLCIDAGDWAFPWECERLPNGERINMGAYGKTLQASLSTTWCDLEIVSGMGGGCSDAR
ncbi:hypothetical protein ACFL6U_22365 [Planctomycetota bacterium]